MFCSSYTKKIKLNFFFNKQVDTAVSWSELQVVGEIKRTGFPSVFIVIKNKKYIFPPPTPNFIPIHF